MAVWELKLVARNVVFRRRMIVICMLAPILMTASLVSMGANSSVIYTQAMLGIRQTVAFDYFVSFPVPLDGVQINEMIQELTDHPEIEEAYPYAVIRYTVNQMGLALCAFPRNSSIMKRLINDQTGHSIDVNKSTLVLTEPMIPALAIGDNLTIRVDYTTEPEGGNIILRFPIQVSDYVQVTYNPRSLTGQLSMYTPVSGGNTPDTILFCDYDNTIAPVIDFFTSHNAQPNEHRFFSGVVVTLDPEVLLESFLEGTQEGLLASIREQLVNLASDFPRHTIFGNTEGEFVILEDVVTRLSFQMLLDSIPLLALTYMYTLIITTQNSEMFSSFDTILWRHGVDRRSRLRILFIECVFISFLASIIGTSLGLVIVALETGVTDFSFYFTPSSSIWFYSTLGMLASLALLYHPARTMVSNRLSALRGSNFANELTQPSSISRRSLGFILVGMYKLFVWSMGISVSALLESIQSNIPYLVYIFLKIAVLPIDSILDYFAPVLLVIGLAELMTVSSRIMSFFRHFAGFTLGMIGTIGAMNMKRNRTRVSRTVFCILLVVTYASFVSANQDTAMLYERRKALAAVGSDISGIVDSDANITELTTNLNSMEGVESTTIEMLYTLTINGYNSPVRAIDYATWLTTAYWESSWFQCSPAQIAQILRDNMSIVLEQRVSHKLEVGIGDSVMIQIIDHENESKEMNMTVAGLFGPSPSPSVNPGDTEVTWSFITSDHASGILAEFPGVARLLVNVAADTDGTLIANQMDAMPIRFILTIDNTLSKVSSDEYQSSLFRINNTIYMMLLSSVGIMAIIIGSMYQRRDELLNMRVRGVRKRDLQKLVLAVYLPLAFLYPLGVLLGLVGAYGTTVVTGSLNPPVLISYNFALSGAFVVNMGLVCLIITLAMLWPVMRYKTQSLRKAMQTY